jgi:hypothetical protein
LSTVDYAVTNIVQAATNDLVLILDASDSNRVAVTPFTSVMTNATVRSSLFEPLWTTNGIEPYSEGPVLDAAHGLGRVPFMVQGWLVCITNDVGYVVGEQISSDAVGWEVNNENQIPFVAIGATATNIWVTVPATTGDAPVLLNKTGGSVGSGGTEMNRARWTLTVHAW